MSRISLDAIARAAREIDPVFRQSPQYRPESLGERLGVDLVVKVETVNPIRSFKGRGADFFVRELGDPTVPLVCASAGNFGQGMAFAARRVGQRLDVFASEVANPLKVARMRAFGATVRQVGRDFDAAKAAAKSWAAEQGAFFVEDGREVAISEGAGSIAVELAAWPEPFDAVVVPLGNGALLGGVATWLKAHAPATRIIGVCAEAAPSMERSWRARQPLETERADTIADGIAVRVPIPEAVGDLQEIVDDMVLVPDAVTLEAMRLLFAHLGLVVEPAGAVGVAALLADAPRFRGMRVATILCGSNLTPEQVAAYQLTGA
ncbi:MAG TPA: threonine/serine dehydratase [Gemmatimonadaceae bacterium]|jgi:threonine dehydratase|nr:threonine/serine dehydratase [Gemmatimonadaceae bacterium]HPV73248.1 threonine/serine dehydratase [Gemmatimonadaceae bacterium]